MDGAKHRKQKGFPEFGNTPGLEELNLVEFPLSLLARQIPESLKTIKFEDTILDRGKGESVHRKVIVTAADEWGLPNAQDMDVFLALLKLTQDKHGFSSDTVEFSLYELRQLLGWPRFDGRYNDRLKLSLDRWLGLTVKYENAWRKKGKWTSTKGFHFLNNVDLTNTRAEYDQDEPQSFVWNKVVVESIRLSNTKGLNWDFYISLKLPSTKRLYRFLDKRFGLGGDKWQSNKWQFDLVPFCTDKLGMSRAYEPRKYKQKISPAVKELEERGFLKPLDIQDRFSKKGRGLYRVQFQKAVRRTQKSKRAANSVAPTGLEKELLELGVRNAAELVAGFKEGKIREQVENFQHRNAHGERKGPAWLRKAIESPEGYGFRKDFVSKTDRKLKAEKVRKRKEADEASEQARVAAEKKESQKRKRQVSKRLNGLSKKQREKFFDEALESAPDFLRKQYLRRAKKGDAQTIEHWKQLILEGYICDSPLGGV